MIPLAREAVCRLLINEQLKCKEEQNKAAICYDFLGIMRKGPQKTFAKIREVSRTAMLTAKA